VIAKALPNDDVIAECEDEVAVVHLMVTAVGPLIIWGQKVGRG
jgi:hypothetical protein